MSEDLAAEHRDAVKLADMAGRALLELRADPPSLRDLGAAGDRMAHQLLVAEINRLYPEDDVRSEEGLEHVAGTGRLWIIDPLDGTREFRQTGRSDWAVHVAMAVGGVAVVGAVALPALDLVLGTVDPPVLPPPRPGEAPHVVVSRSRPPDVAYEVTEAIGGVWSPWGRPAPRSPPSSSAWPRCTSMPVASTSGTRAHRLRWLPRADCTPAGSTGSPSAMATPTCGCPTSSSAGKEYAEAVLAVTTRQSRPYW